jgi:hypothetical protein
MLALGNLAKKQKSKKYSINNDIDYSAAVSDVVQLLIFIYCKYQVYHIQDRHWFLVP